MTTRALPQSTRARDRLLPADPLLRQVELAGGGYGLGIRKSSAEERTLLRARQRGYITEWQADRLCTRLLGLTPPELWGQTYWNLLD